MTQCFARTAVRSTRVQITAQAAYDAWVDWLDGKDNGPLADAMIELKYALHPEQQRPVKSSDEELG